MKDSALSANLLALMSEDTNAFRIEYQRGAMNYIGSKHSCLSQIFPLIPITDRWVDVYGGSGVVTLNRPRVKFEVYNDRHSGLVAFYKMISSEAGTQALKERCSLFPHSRELFIDYLKGWEVEDDLERAARWYYIVQTSVMGRCEAFGRDLKAYNTVYRKIHEQLELFPIIHDRFKNVLVENLDWRQCLGDFDSPDTVFYMDPPYWGSDIYEHKMDKIAHIEMCGRIFECKGFVAVSGYANEVYDQFPWDGVHRIEVDNQIANMFGPKTADRTEWLWIKEAYV